MEVILAVLIVVVFVVETCERSTSSVLSLLRRSKQVLEKVNTASVILPSHVPCLDLLSYFYCTWRSRKCAQSTIYFILLIHSSTITATIQMVLSLTGPFRKNGGGDCWDQGESLKILDASGVRRHQAIGR